MRATGRPAFARIALVGVVALAAGGAALGTAALLDQPVDRAARDSAQAVVGTVAPSTTTGPSAPAPAASTLPPLAVVLATGAPAEITALSPSEQIVRLREGATADARPATYLQLGRAYMVVGDAPSARQAFRTAAELAPRAIEPAVALAMADGMDGTGGLDRAAARIGAIVARNPRSQMAVFNRGWLAVYRDDAATAVSSWRRTVALGPSTALGRTARTLLSQIPNAAG